MVVDSSAIVAILRSEPGFEVFAKALLRPEQWLISAVNYLEASLVMVGSASPRIAARVDEFLLVARIEIVPFDRELALQARAAFLAFGKGRHPAALNMGDCAAYALAKSRSLPLLYKGRDFARTDVASALP